jgi:hypothetical protein
MAVGTIIDLSRILDSRHYDNTIPELELAEQDAARVMYWDFVDRFSCDYVLVQRGYRVDPKEGFFRAQLLHMTCALIACKYRAHDLDATFSPAKLKHEVLQHFEKHHADLKADLVEQIANNVDSTFAYAGPPTFGVDIRQAGEKVWDSFRPEFRPIRELPSFFPSFVLSKLAQRNKFLRCLSSPQETT